MKLISFEDTGKFLMFEKIRPTIRLQVQKAGIQDVPYNLFGALFWTAVGISLSVFTTWAWPNYIQPLNLGLQFILSFSLIVLLISGITAIFISGLYIFFDLRVFNRKKEMEDILPDFFRYLIENLKGGLSFEQALWESIKPRFGVMAQEMKLVVKRVSTGDDLTVALKEFANKYNSPTIKRSINLIIESIGGGSELCGILEKIESDIRSNQELRKEIEATNSAFTMFIKIIICTVSPVLFGLGYTVLTVLDAVSGKIAPALEAGIQGSELFGKMDIKPESLINFGYVSLVMVGIGATLIMSLIKNGNVKQGILSIPIYLIISIVVFHLAMFLLNKMFGSMF